MVGLRLERLNDTALITIWPNHRRKSVHSTLEFMTNYYVHWLLDRLLYLLLDIIILLLSSLSAAAALTATSSIGLLVQLHIALHKC